MCILVMLFYSHLQLESGALNFVAGVKEFFGEVVAFLLLVGGGGESLLDLFQQIGGLVALHV